MTQKGLAPILIVLILATLVGGYLVYQNQTKPTSPPPQTVQLTPTPSSNTESTGSAETANWKTYTNNEYYFELNYPSDWSVKIFNESQFILGKKSDLEILTAEMLNHGWSEGMSIDIYKTEYSSAEVEKEGIEKSPPNGEENLNHYQYIKMTLGGKTANKTVSLSKEEYFQFPYTSIIFNFKGHGWNVMFPNINYKGDYDKIYDQILSTFKFLP